MSKKKKIANSSQNCIAVYHKNNTHMYIASGKRLFDLKIY